MGWSCRPAGRNPTTGIAACCPRATSGHVTAAPPTTVMNSRRLIQSPHLRAQAIDGGTVRPSVLAVLRLITSSNLVGCSTGRSTDRRTSQNFVDVPGGPAEHLRKVRAVGHQPAGLNDFSPRVHAGNSALGGEADDDLSVGIVRRVYCNEEGLRPILANNSPRFSIVSEAMVGMDQRHPQHPRSDPDSFPAGLSQLLFRPRKATRPSRVGFL